MAGFDDLLNPDARALAGATVDGKPANLTFTDADTLTDGNNRYRLKGVNAAETYHPGVAGKEFQEDGAAMTTEQVIKLANSQGFTRVVPVGEVDAYGRQEVDLYDKNGRSFNHLAISSGVFQPADPRYDRTGSAFSAAFGRATRQGDSYKPDSWDMAAESIANTIEKQRDHEQQFKVNQESSGDWGRYRDSLFRNYLDRTAELAGVSVDELDDVQRNNAARAAEAEADRVYNRGIADFEYSDRTVDTGRAFNPLSEAWDTGLLGLQAGLYGAAEMAGETVGWEWLERKGTGGVERKETEISEQARYISDYDLIDQYGEGWTTKVSDTLEYIGTNAAMSLPYMAATVGASITAPVTGGASLAVPATIYAGQTWNEMEGEKDASVAVTSGILQAMLDNIGVGLIFKGTGKATRDILKEAAEKYAAKNNVSLKEAKAKVAGATRAQIAVFTETAVQTAKDQLRARQLAKKSIERLSKGAIGEGATEALQESTAYLGAVIGSEKEFDANELIERAEKAAVAGAALGGSFSVPGSVIDAGAWADVAYRKAPAEDKRVSDAGRWANHEIKEHGRVITVKEINDEVGAAIEGGAQFATLDERVDADKARRRARTKEDLLTETALSIPGLWRGTIRHTIPQHIKDASRTARKLADQLGGQLQKTFSGAAFENEKFHRVAQYKNMVPIPERVFSVFNNGKVATGKRKNEISDQIYDTLQAATDKQGNFDPALVPEGPLKQEIVKLQADLQRLSDKMWADQRKFNPDLGRINNYLGRYKALSKKAVAKNKNGFVDALLANPNYKGTRAEAIALADEIINNAEVNDFEEAFSAVRGEFKPEPHQERTINMAEDANFQEFLERDLFANVSNAVRSAARYTTQQDFIGKNGEKIAYQLNEIQKELIDAGNSPEAASQIVNKMASGLKDYIDAESGNYKRATSKAGKTLQAIQKNFMFYTMIVGLPLATVSSLVELALTMRGLTADQIFGKGGLKTIAKEFGDTLMRGTLEIANYVPGTPQADRAETVGKHNLRRLGFYEWDVGAATVTGATEINPLRQKVSEHYFKITGLSGWTNYTRAVRGSIAVDYINDKLGIAMAADPDHPTNEEQEAAEALRNLGINVQDMIAIEVAQITGTTTPEMEQQFEENIREAMFNFINDAVALPQAANRPLIYQDPRFALFTQFQGFIATFTANHIPKLWGEYVKRGTPAMKYNAFAIMTTMIMLGFLSQYLKDLIKYGTEKNPYLDDPEYIQRGIRASGLFGSAERLLDQFAPIYESRSRGVGDWIYNQTTGEAPTLSTVARGGKAVGKFLEGEGEQGIYNLLKATPIVAPLTDFNKALAKSVAKGEWAFRGDNDG